MDSNDLGRSAAPSGSRASHEAASSTASSPEASIPNALVDALGSIVSMIGDAPDTFPDDETTLQAVTEAVNELYGCVVDGVFAPLAYPLAEEAYGEALRRYPDAAGALAFLWGASGLGVREVSAEQLAWGRSVASAIEARRAATEDTGAVHESAIGNAETPKPSRGTDHG